MSAAPRRLRLAGELDVADAARAARELAAACGLSPVEAQQVATAVSEVATNACKYGGGGEVVLEPDTWAGRAGLRVCVRDAGPGIADVPAAMRDGISEAGSLGLGLPGARRLMDAFAIETEPGRGTVVRMARWAGARGPGDAALATRERPGPGGVALAQPYRNGMLLAVAAGPRAEAAAAAWRLRPWPGPARLAAVSRRGLDPGERLGAALAAFSLLDGRLEWLAAGGVTAALVRGERVTARAPGCRALAAAGPAPRAATADVRRDDVLVLAAAPLDDAALLALAAPRPPARGPAALVARFARGTLEPRRPPPPDAPHRRRSDSRAGTTLDGP
jgi:anti-sigma regulatory factor (Ser/Thr protein kinase)